MIGAGARLDGRRMRERPGGFTLVELVAVFGILALVAAVAVPAFRRWVREDDLTLATRRIEALFTLARDSAIRGGAPVSVVLDSVSGRVWLDALRSGDEVEELVVPPAPGSTATPAWGGTAPRPNPRETNVEDEGTSLELPSSVKLEVPRARARFTFGPGGAAWADTLVLRTMMETRIVSLDPWTGDVVVR